MDAETLPDLLRTRGFVIEAATESITGEELEAAARRYAGGLSQYPRGAGVLIGVSDAITALSVAAGAWWAGLRVAFVRADSPYGRERQRRAVDAAVEIADPGLGRAAGGRPGRHTPAELLAAPVAGPPRCTAEDAALDVLTSGSTGAPKCVVFDHAALVANARALASSMAVTGEDRIWTCLDPGLPGALGTVTLPAAAGMATAVLTAPGDPLASARSLAASRPSIVYAVPDVYEALGRFPAAQTGQSRTIRWWLSSSSRLSPTRFDRMYDRWGAIVRSFYCGSEIGTVTFNDAADAETVRDTVGRPLPGVSVEVTGGARSAGVQPATGSLVVGGALTGRGYREEGELRAFPRSGIRTRDIGAIDERGFLRLMGREDDRIHVGADIIDPEVVESRIATHPAVEDCIVVGRAHPRLGDVLEARVVRRTGSAVTERDIILACHTSGLRGGWLPRAVTWIDSVPRTQAGKPERGRPQAER